MIKKLLTVFLTLLFFLTVPPKLALAHSFGKLYNLPVPFWMYLYGGATALFVSFLIIGYFFNKKSSNLSYRTIDLSQLPVFGLLTTARFFSFLKIVSVSLFLLTIITGVVGEDMPSFNFNMTFFWIIFVLLFAYLTALIGNVYAIVNPWKVLVEWAETFLGNKFKGAVKYPKQFGYYPALLFYFLFIWIELFANTTPLKLSIILIQYTLLNFLGVGLVGKDSWFKYCDFFSVFFRLISKIAPVELRSGKLYLRPPLVGLLKEKAEHFSLLLFILFMLSSTAFDGFSETLPWATLYWRNLDDVLRPVLGTSSYNIFQSTGLLLSPLIFLIIYLVLVFLAKVITRTKASLSELSLQFAFSLIPIAFVYNIAHYYTLIITEGQSIVRLISDPFGFGWNLFGTANWSSGIVTVDTGFVWHSQVAFILIGHIVSVYLAHAIALNLFPSRRTALMSQFPMLLLMVAYTVIGLWILSQPITGGTL